MGLAMPLVLFFATIGDAVAVGFQTVVARKLGQGDREGASSAFNYILILTMVISIAGAVLTFLFADQLAVLLGTVRGSYEHLQVMGYLKGYAIGIPAYSVMLLLSPVMFIDSDKNSITDGKMELVDRMLKTISEIYANAEQQKAELNLRVYETGSELRCSIETELTDPVGRYEQMAHQDKNSISFSEVFGLKRIVVEDLRNE